VAPEASRTTTSTRPARAAAGVTARTVEPEITRYDGAREPPKYTATTVPSPAPRTVTVVPPSTGPVRGETLATPTAAESVRLNELPAAAPAAVDPPPPPRVL